MQIRAMKTCFLIAECSLPYAKILLLLIHPIKNTHKLIIFILNVLLKAPSLYTA